MSWEYYNYNDRAPSNPNSKEHKKFKALEKAKSIEAVVITHRLKIATSFWGRGWCDHLESFSDYENRLPRGRTYARKGTVRHLNISPGVINAFVQGSDLYEQTIRIEPLPQKKWKALQSQCQGKISSLIELLNGKISKEIMSVVTDENNGLFPKPNEIQLQCSCPDWAAVCKHIAAVLYAVGARLDQKPELLFLLRGVDHTDLISATDPVSALGGGGGKRRRLDAAAFGDVFGEDFDHDFEESPVPPVAPGKVAEAPPKPAPRKRKPAGKSVRRVSPKVAAQRIAFLEKAMGKKMVPNRKGPPFRLTAKVLIKLRNRLGLTQAEFAEKIGVSAQSVRSWESKTGKLNIRQSSYEQIEALYRLHS